MLNMALLNILSGGAGGGSGGMPDLSNYNIFGINSPCVQMNNCGHFPTTVHIWNRHLTCFLQNIRCEDTGCSPFKTAIGVGGCPTIGEAGGARITYTTGTPSEAKGNITQYWGLATMPILCSYQELCWGFIDMFWAAAEYQKYIGDQFNRFIEGYAEYWEHLAPLPGQLTLNVTSTLSEFVGGTVWVAGITTIADALPAFASTYCPLPVRTPLRDGTPRNGENWEMICVPIRGATNYPKDDLSNRMMYGFMQVEYPNQIGYGLSYSFGLAKDPNCLPKKSSTKCGGQVAGNIDWSPAKKLFGGFAAFNLDNFLQPFIRAGKLRSYEDAAKIYNDLDRLLWNHNKGDDGYVGESMLKNYPQSGNFVKSKNSIWQGLIDGWLEQPYKDIFNEIGADSMYYIHALQQQYPTECNFKSIMGCGAGFDRGIVGNSAICAMTDAMSVFKALASYPDDFPVDLPRLIAAT